MILSKTLSKTWWRSLVKNEGGNEEANQEDSNQEDFSSQEQPRHEELRASNVDSVPQINNQQATPDEDLADDDEHHSITHEGAEDPLTEAFEHTQQSDLSPPVRNNRGAPAEPKLVTAKDFFQTEILYRYDLIGPELREQLFGTYRLEIKGFKGGIWTVILGDDVQVFNRREEADVVLSIQQRDFVGIINGDLNPQLAITAQKVRPYGDFKRAVLFQTVLAPPLE